MTRTLPRAAAPVAAALAATCLSAGAAQAAEPTGPRVTDFALDNGMQVVVIEDNRAPVVTHMVWYRVGSADEPAGQSGIAHFLEHLMFKGTDDVPSGEFSKIVAANGGQDNAFTSLDFTGYFQRIARDRLGLVMEMEADRMTDLILEDGDVATERDVVLEERSSRTDNDPTSLFYEQMNASLYLNHPYGRPIVGWRSEIEALDRGAALEFYERFYGPDNAILVVAGDVTPEEVRALAETHYGRIEPRGVGPRPRPAEPPHLAPRRVAMTDPRVRQPFVSRVYLTPSYVTGEPGQAEALALLAEILGGGRTSRLSRRLVLQDETALSAGAGFRGVARDYGSFSLFGVPVPGRDLAAVEADLDAVLADLIEGGVEADELERAKMVLISSAIYRQDSQAGMARMYGNALTVGLTVEDVQSWPDRMRAITPEDVVAAARSLRREASVTGTLTAGVAPGGESVQ